MARSPPTDPIHANSGAPTSTVTGPTAAMARIDFSARMASAQASHVNKPAVTPAARRRTRSSSNTEINALAAFTTTAATAEPTSNRLDGRSRRPPMNAAAANPKTCDVEINPTDPILMPYRAAHAGLGNGVAANNRDPAAAAAIRASGAPRRTTKARTGANTTARWYGWGRSPRFPSPAAARRVAVSTKHECQR